MSRRDEHSFVLGNGTSYSGNLRFSGILRLNGRFEGRIRSEGTLILGPQATVNGNIRVGSLYSAGRITGDVEAAHRVELTDGATVKGDILTDTLSMGAGCCVDGDVTILSGTQRRAEADGSGGGHGAFPPLGAGQWQHA